MARRSETRSPRRPGPLWRSTRLLFLLAWIQDPEVVRHREDVRNFVRARADQRVVELVVDHAFQGDVPIVDNDMDGWQRLIAVTCPDVAISVNGLSLGAADLPIHG